MRSSRISKIHCQQSFPTWFLLADYACSGRKLGDILQGLPAVQGKSHQPASALKTIPIAWPFPVWGLDMVGPFKRARSGMTHLLVVVDKFTKWIEARPIKKLDGPTAVRFVADLVCRYG